MINHVRMARQYLAQAEQFLSHNTALYKLLDKEEAKSVRKEELKMVRRALSSAIKQCEVALNKAGGQEDTNTVW